MERVQSVIKRIESHDNIERYTSLGIDCFTGAAQFFSPHEITLDGKNFSTKNIIAIGARPIIPPVSGLDQRIKRRATSLQGNLPRKPGM
jgi:pyruvate/2-oxoglutarate dehydrogenase complex dihydrolipoamide dehydrogenase (E3) component